MRQTIRLPAAHHSGGDDTVNIGAAAVFAVTVEAVASVSPVDGVEAPLKTLGLPELPRPLGPHVYVAEASAVAERGHPLQPLGQVPLVIYLLPIANVRSGLAQPGPTPGVRLIAQVSRETLHGISLRSCAKYSCSG